MKIDKKWTKNKGTGRKGHIPILIGNHITEGSYNGAISWLMNRASSASAHFVISRKGEITQMVKIGDTAWTQGTSVKTNSKVSYKHSTLKAVNKSPINANLITVGIEHEGFSNQTGGALTEKQYQATLYIHKLIIEEVKKKYNYDIPINREHIVGHYEIAPITKPNCPGKNFPFDRLIKDLKDWRKGGNKKAESIIRVNYNNKNYNIEGYIEKGETWLSLRDFIEKTGGTINWNKEEQIAELSIAANVNINTSYDYTIINGIKTISKVKLKINNKNSLIDGYIKDGITYIKLKDFINNTDWKLDWERSSRTVIIK